MAKKSELESYIKMIEEIQEEYPQASDRLEQLLNKMQDDYNSFVYREVERQKFQRREHYKDFLEKEEYKKIEALEPNEFIVVMPADKAAYRLARSAVSAHHEDREFSMRFTRGVGTVLTRIR